ncbi:MAG: histidine triad nucleotide-binding protein [Planctomycetota bacterium]
MAGCIFCNIVAGKIPSESVAQGRDWLAFHDLQPQAPTHILLIPKRHIASLSELEKSDTELVGRLVWSATEIARDQGLAESGYRLVWNIGPHGGQAVYHIHLHLLGGRALSWPPG